MVVPPQLVVCERGKKMEYVEYVQNNKISFYIETQLSGAAPATLHFLSVCVKVTPLSNDLLCCSY